MLNNRTDRLAVSRYVIFKFFFITVTRFSLSLGVSVGSVAFAALQVTSLFLVTTPPEEMALAFRWFATPLRLLRIPVDRLTLLLLLSLRFVSMVRSCMLCSARSHT
jgi:energy-coupling factor transporter transmembrane protein EcfT